VERPERHLKGILSITLFVASHSHGGGLFVWVWVAIFLKCAMISAMEVEPVAGCALAFRTCHLVHSTVSSIV
jgi:hypothetical protein